MMSESERTHASETPVLREQRVEPRRKIEMSMAVDVVNAPGLGELDDRTLHCATRDVSTRGVRLCLHSPVPLGTVLRLRPRPLPGLAAEEHGLAGTGRVVWMREVIEDHFITYHMGVQFTSKTSRFAPKERVSALGGMLN